MITLGEIRRIADQTGTDPATVEKDYALSWMLKGVYSDQVLRELLVFKGATALRKAFYPDYRFSVDLHFTLVGPFSAGDLQERLTSACQRIEAWTQIAFSLEVLQPTREGPGEESFEARISFIGPRRQRQDPPRIRLDMTSWEEVVVPPEERPLLHPYSDRCEANLPVLSLDEILAEKMRSILQRIRPSDLYDVWYLLKHQRSMFSDKVRELFPSKCQFKNVDFSSASNFFEEGRMASQRAAWDSSLRRLMGKVPAFDSVVEDLKLLLPQILPD